MIVESLGNRDRRHEIAIIINRYSKDHDDHENHSMNNHLPPLNPVAITTDHPTFRHLAVATKDWICLDGASPPAADHPGVIVLQLPGIVGKSSNKNPV